MVLLSTDLWVSYCSVSGAEPSGMTHTYQLLSFNEDCSREMPSTNCCCLILCFYFKNFSTKVVDIIKLYCFSPCGLCHSSVNKCSSFKMLNVIYFLTLGLSTRSPLSVLLFLSSMHPPSQLWMKLLPQESITFAF